MRTRLRSPLTLVPLALTVALAAGIALPALAGPGARGAGFPLRRALRQLDLSDAQKDQLRSAREARRPVFEELRSRLRTDRAALKGLLDAGTKDYTAIGKAVVRMDETRRALKSEREKARATLETILTPEQKARLEGFLRGLRAGRRGDHGFGRFGGSAGPMGRPGRGGPEAPDDLAGPGETPE